MKKVTVFACLWAVISLTSCWSGTYSGADIPDSLELPAYKSTEDVIRHEAYVTCYNHKTLCPDWVAWELTSDETRGHLSRDGYNFSWEPDTERPKSAREDYSNSGWDKGHMAPAADMNWSDQTMKECFYLSNICPQDHEMNSGDWEYIESACRRFARQYGKVWIVCGPIYDSTPYRTIGRDKVAIPDRFFKAMLIRKQDGQYSAIAFVMPNKAEHHDPYYYKRTVDEVEAIIGRDLFPNLPDEVEETVESRVISGDWGI